MGWIIKKWRYWCLVIILFFGGLWQLNKDKTYLFLEPDSESYYIVAEEITDLKAPIFSDRTPTYPFLMSPFVLINKLDWMMYFSLILGTAGGAATLWLTDKMFRYKIINLFLVLFLWLDYGVINFRSMLMTESIAPVLIILMLVVNIYWWNNGGKKGWQWVLIVDILAAFLKPTFILLPLVLKLFFLLINFRTNTVKIRHSALSKAILWSLLIIVILPLYNFTTGYGFKVSAVKDVNILGIVMRNGYMNNDVGNPPSNVANVVDIFRDEPTVSVWDLMISIQKKENLNNKDMMKLTDQVNDYFMKRNFGDYLTNVLQAIPWATSWNREYYDYVSPPEGLYNNTIFQYFERYYNQFNTFKWTALLINTVIFLVLWIKKDKRAIVLGSMLAVCWVIIIGISAFSMSEYYRLRQPVDLILGWFIFYPFSFLKFDFS